MKLLKYVLLPSYLFLTMSAFANMTQWGSEVVVGQGSVKTYIITNDSGAPMELGIAMNAGSLQGLPDQMHQYDYILPLPTNVAIPPFKLVMLNWNPHGHEPESIYGAPHFDFHFYTISNDERMTITCSGDDQAVCMKQPAADHIPPYYAPTDFGVPMMGWHWFDTRSPEFHGQPFTSTILYGYYNAKMAFIEPMITLDFLKGHNNVDQEVPVPQAVDEPGSYPSRYKLQYDSVQDLVMISITDFVAK